MRFNLDCEYDTDFGAVREMYSTPSFAAQRAKPADSNHADAGAASPTRTMAGELTVTFPLFGKMIEGQLAKAMPQLAKAELEAAKAWLAEEQANK